MLYNRTVLDNGITVVSEHMDSVRSITLGIWFAVGSRDETPAEAGLSHFMEHMMFKGTPTRSAKDISEEFDRMGAELNAGTSKEYTMYYARFLDEHLPKAFELLGDMVANSLCADEECERDDQRQQAGIRVALAVRHRRKSPCCAGKAGQAGLRHCRQGRRR